MASPLLGVVLLLALFSGCAGPSGSNDGSDDEITTITDPKETAYLLNGTDQGYHFHDYWRGTDRLTVMDLEDDTTFLLGGGSASTTSYRPDDGVVVPQGTASVEMTMSWTDNQPGYYGDIELWVKTQDARDPVLVGVVQDGQTLTMETNASDADLPHQVLSAWAFQLRIRSPAGQPTQPVTGQVRSYSIQLTLKAEAIRGLDLVPFPPHPDLWGNATDLPFIMGASGTTLLWSDEPPACGFCSGGLPRDVPLRPDNGTRVPVGAGVVQVTMTYERDTPTGLRLLYHGADTHQWKDAPITSDSAGVRVHDIPVGDGQDGPYADQSLWEFYFGFEDGRGPYSGSWSLTAKVIKA